MKSRRTLWFCHSLATTTSHLFYASTAIYHILIKELGPYMELRTESISQHRVTLARELLDDLELGRLTPEALILKASRLARIMEATEVQSWLKNELRGYGPLDEIGKKYASMTGRITDHEKLIGYWQPFAGLIGIIRAWEAELSSLRVPDVNYSPSSSNPNEWVGGIYGGNVMTATSPANKALDRMQQLGTQISTLRGVVSKVTAVLHEFVSQTYYELAFRGIAESIFESHRKQVDALLAGSAGDALQKIPAIAERLASGDVEATSHAMTTARRVLCSFADALQPSMTEPQDHGGQPLDCGPDKYLNRLRYYIRQHSPSRSRDERLVTTIRNLYDRFSAGTHAEVSPDEARALFVLLYVTLGEILSLSQRTKTEGSKSSSDETPSAVPTPEEVLLPVPAVIAKEATKS